MKRQYSKKYLVWLFPAVVAGMIFLFSSQHAEESSHLSNIFVHTFTGTGKAWGVSTGHRCQSVTSFFHAGEERGTCNRIYYFVHIFSDRVLGIRDSWKRAQYRILCADIRLCMYGRAGRFTDVLIDSSGALVLSLIVVLVMHSRTMRGKRVRRRKSK